MAFIHKRAAQLYSKSRFIAAQFDAYFDDGLWLETARHANSLAARLAGHIRASKKIRLAWEPAANEVFARHDALTKRDRLLKKGAVFFDWHTPHDYRRRTRAAGEIICRFVTSFATTAERRRRARRTDRLSELITADRNKSGARRRRSGPCCRQPA